MSATKQTHVCIKTNSRFHQNVQTYFYVNTGTGTRTLSRCRRFVICGTMTRKLKVIRNPADCKSAGTTGRGRNNRGETEHRGSRNTYPFTLPQICNLRYDDTQAESNPESGRLQICRNTGGDRAQGKPEHVPPQVQGVCMILPGSE